jgi:hypothetical protein
MQRLSHVVLLEHAAGLAAAMRAARISHFFAKGVALLGSWYRPGERQLADIDLYVPLGAKPEAVRVVEAMGFTPVPERDQAGPPELRSSLSLGRSGGGPMYRTSLDLHWALDPLDRVFPRPDQAVPDRFFAAARGDGTLTVPSPEHHAAILTHHLAHSDLLHLRSLLDLAYVLHDVTADAGREYRDACRELGVARLAGALGRLIEREFGIGTPGAPDDRGARFLDRLTLVNWLLLAATAPPADRAAITPARLARRLKIVGVHAWRGLAADIVRPPEAFLRWRWETDDIAAARRKHYAQIARKALGMPAHAGGADRGQ